MLGKTNVPLLGLGADTVNPLFGLTRNPWDLRLSTAGSSGGAAAALAAGMAWLAQGSDLGGSIRGPCSLCGVAGLRPSPGRVAQGGIGTARSPSAVLLPQIAAGQVTFGYANPDLAIIALSRGEPIPVRFVMNWLRSQTFEFVVPEASPLRSLADLRGRKLGVGALTWGNLPLSRAMLGSVGIGWNRDVEVLPVGLGAAAWRRLQTGEVDALNLFVSKHERMAIAGIPFRRLEVPETFRALFSNGWVASERTLAERPALVEAFGRALTRSWIACRANPEACVRATWAAGASLRPPTGQEEARMRADLRLVLADRNQIDDFSGAPSREYGAFPPGAWERLVGVMHAEGQIPRGDLDLSRLFTDRFVAGINRFDAAAAEAAGRAAN